MVVHINWKNRKKDADGQISKSEHNDDCSPRNAGKMRGTFPSTQKSNSRQAYNLLAQRTAWGILEPILEYPTRVIGQVRFWESDGKLDSRHFLFENVVLPLIVILIVTNILSIVFCMVNITQSKRFHKNFNELLLGTFNFNRIGFTVLIEFYSVLIEFRVV